MEGKTGHFMGVAFCLVCLEGTTYVVEQWETKLEKQVNVVISRLLAPIKEFSFQQTIVGRAE